MTSRYIDIVKKLAEEVSCKRDYEYRYKALQKNFQDINTLIKQNSDLLEREKSDFITFMQSVQKAGLKELKDPKWVGGLFSDMQKRITEIKDEIRTLYQGANKKIKLLQNSSLNQYGSIHSFQSQLSKISKTLQNPALSKEELKSLHIQLNKIKDAYLDISKQKLLEKLDMDTKVWNRLYKDIASSSFKREYENLKRSITHEKSLSSQENHYHKTDQWFEQLYLFLISALKQQTNYLLGMNIFLGESVYSYKQQLEYYLQQSSLSYDDLQKWYDVIKEIKSQKMITREREILFSVCLNSDKEIVGFELYRQKVAFIGTISRCKKRIFPLYIPFGVVEKSSFYVTFPKHAYWTYFLLKVLSFGKIESVKPGFSLKNNIIKKNNFRFGRVFTYLPKVWWGGENIYRFINFLNKPSNYPVDKFELLLKKYV
jgi:hypothetical protein